AERRSAHGQTRRPLYEPSMGPTTELSGLAKTVKPVTHTPSPEHQHQPDLPRSHHGAPTMLNQSDEEWLRSTYPALVPAGDAVTGTIDFRASYNHQTNRFLILG